MKRIILVIVFFVIIVIILLFNFLKLKDFSNEEKSKINFEDISLFNEKFLINLSSIYLRKFSNKNDTKYFDANNQCKVIRYKYEIENSKSIKDILKIRKIDKSVFFYNHSVIYLQKNLSLKLNIKNKIEKLEKLNFYIDSKIIDSISLSKNLVSYKFNSGAFNMYMNEKFNDEIILAPNDNSILSKKEKINFLVTFKKVENYLYIIFIFDKEGSNFVQAINKNNINQIFKD